MGSVFRGKMCKRAEDVLIAVTVHVGSGQCCDSLRSKRANKTEDILGETYHGLAPLMSLSRAESSSSLVAEGGC